MDYVLTFEELRAILDARGLELAEMPEITAGEPSSYGRIFARTGGVAESVRRVAKLEGIETEINPIRCSGIEECIKTMKLAPSADWRKTSLKAWRARVAAQTAQRPSFMTREGFSE